MDACARIRGVPLKARSVIRKEMVRESSVSNVKGLLKSKKELCRVLLEQPSEQLQCLAEIHFVGLPIHSEGEHITPQALPSLPVYLLEVLRSLHTQSLRDDEVLLLKDSKNLLERKNSVSQDTCFKAVCVFRKSHHIQQAGAVALLDLLNKYTAGIRYVLEQQMLQKGSTEAGQVEDDDTNQSVSSIEDDFVTAFEHLEEDDSNVENPLLHRQRNQRDVASQTVSSNTKDIAGSRVIICSHSKKTFLKKKPLPNTSVSVQCPASARLLGEGIQWNIYTPGNWNKRCNSSTSLTESDESDCSSPSPIIFLDEVGYQKSLEAKLDIPQIPLFKDGVEDSDSEVSEFFDSFDQFDDHDQSLETTSKLLNEPATTHKAQMKEFSIDCSSSTMNLHRFDQPVLPANVKKPTPLKPDSLSDVPDSPCFVKTLAEETGVLFSPVRTSAFSPLGESSSLEYFWKPVEDTCELCKPQDLCALYKTYSDFANNMSKEILSSVCGYSSPVDMNINKNLSCVCHKKFTSSSGHLMKLSEIQETITISKSLKPQTLKDGIQKFATDLVERSLGSAFRDLQKGVTSCTTTLCHLAARLTSSVFQMAFHEIGMRQAYILKERAINGLANFLVGEAVSGALKEFQFVKKQIFNNTVARFAADLAEECVFEGIMEVCQFSHPSTPLTPRDWSFDQEEEVVSSYASDLSESVLQEAFIELSQADVTFTTQAAISVSFDNVRYVSAENLTNVTKTCNAAADYGLPYTVETVDNSCTVKKAIFCISGIASCVPVPVAGKAISTQNPIDTCHFKSSVCPTSQTSPKKSCSSERRLVMTSSLKSSTQKDVQLAASDVCCHEIPTGFPSDGQKYSFQKLSGNIVDSIVSEVYELRASPKIKKNVEGCGDDLDKKIECLTPSDQEMCHNLISDSIDVCPLIEHTVENLHFLKNAKETKDLVSIPDTTLGTQSNTNDSAHLATSYKSGDPCFTKGSPADHFSNSSLKPCGPRGFSVHPYETDLKNLYPSRDGTLDFSQPFIKYTLEVPSFEVSGRGSRKFAGDELPGSDGKKMHFAPNTPPSTTYKPCVVSQDNQSKEFSKKLKSELAKEFLPATQPSTSQLSVDASLDTENTNFVVKLMRFLSEEADSKCKDEGQDVSVQPSTQHRVHIKQSTEMESKIMAEGAFRYAECLACHIVSMATDMHCFCIEDEQKYGDRDCIDNHHLSTSKFSERTLNSLWIYAGEIAGEVISDVKKIIGSRCQSEDEQHIGKTSSRQCANDVGSSALISQVSVESGLSSKYPSCESVTDEYSRYLIRVLKTEGCNRELILDQYGSLLAYRSVKSGLTHLAKKMKQSPSVKLHPHQSCMGRQPSVELAPCTCSNHGNMTSRDYIQLVTFAESLAYNITCEVSRNLKLSSVRLPKSLTDSCLYKKSKLDNMTENLLRTTFSCSLVSRTEKGKQYHSMGSLNTASFNDGVRHAIQHYAKKIVDDTLALSIASACQQMVEDKKMVDQRMYAEKLSGAILRSALADKACCYCIHQDLCRTTDLSKQRMELELSSSDCCTRARVHGLEIPKIHIDLEKKAALAEDVVSLAIEKAKRELSSASLNADSGIGHDGASFAESLTAEIMTSAMSNICQTINPSVLGKDRAHMSESNSSQQLSLSVGDDSIGSWSNLSFEEEHMDESSSFLHLSDSNGNSSSWSSLGLEGEIFEERLSFSPSDSEGTEEKETMPMGDFTCFPQKPRLSAGDRGLLVVNLDGADSAVDVQVRAMLQWIAASTFDLPLLLLGQQTNVDLHLLPAMLHMVREREWKVGELLQALLRYGDQAPEGGRECYKATPLFQWLTEQA